MALKKFDIQSLLEIPKKLGSPVFASVMYFDENLMLCQSHVYKIRRHAADQERLATHNFSVNAISQLEVLCKRLIIEYREVWDKNSYDKLLEAKISLSDAFKLMQIINETKEEKDVLTIEHIISENNSFSNFDSIISVFGKLLNKETTLREELGEFHLDDEVTTLNSMGDWQAEIRNIFNMRNKFVHEIKFTLDIDIVKIHDTIRIFGLVLTFFIHKINYNRLTHS